MQVTSFFNQIGKTITLVDLIFIFNLKSFYVNFIFKKKVSANLSTFLYTFAIIINLYLYIYISRTNFIFYHTFKQKDYK